MSLFGQVNRGRWAVIDNDRHIIERHKRINAENARKAEEVRVTDPKTGGMKGRKQAQLGDVDPASLLELAKVAGFGGDKYERYNFLKGYAWSLSFDAFMRHALAFWGGEDLDPESGLPHTAHMGWHALTLTAFLLHGLGTDDRPPTSRPADER